MIDLSKLDKHRETDRIEAKRALGGLPESIWETYSAFANTRGGTILLGVEEYGDKSLHPIDIAYPEEMVAEFLVGLNDKKRVSANTLGADDISIELVDGKRIIVIRVPSAEGDDYPVYINGDPINGAYVRIGEADHKINSASLSAAEIAAIDSIRREK